MEVRNRIDFKDMETAFVSKSNPDLRRANFIFSLINYPFLTELGKSLARFALALRLPVTGMIRKTIFNHFCGGVSIEDCEKTIQELHGFGVQTILDYSAEGEKNEEGFEVTKREILKIIERGNSEEAIPFSVFKMTGLASTELLEKVSTGDLSAEETSAYERVKGRVDEICSAAYSVGLPIMFDAEETWIQGPIDDLCYEMMAKYNQESTIVYNTYQMYRTDSLDRLKESHSSMAARGLKFGAKLVRGAYMEKERERAEEMGYPSPIHSTKGNTDTCFDDGLRYCADNIMDISVVCGSHNEASNLLLAELMEEGNHENNHANFWFAQLYGMSDHISFNLAKAGYNVTKYVPYGPVRSVMPYLFRRAEENTSVKGQSSRELSMIREEIKRRKSA